MRQTEPPELPGPVEALPFDALTWGFWTLSLLVVLWTLGRGLFRTLAARKHASPKNRSIQPVRQAEDTFADLADRLELLSADQREEAHLLSLGLRQACGRIHGHDLGSTTDTRLLDLMEVEASDPETLAELLAFATGILFAGRRESAKAWARRLQQAREWNRSRRPEA